MKIDFARDAWVIRVSKAVRIGSRDGIDLDVFGKHSRMEDLFSGEVSGALFGCSIDFSL